MKMQKLDQIGLNCTMGYLRTATTARAPMVDGV